MMKKSSLLIAFVLLCMSTLTWAQTSITVNSELRMVNENQCNGYTAHVALPYSTVKQYLKKQLNQYGKNVGKKGTFVYQNAKVIGMQDLVTIYAQADKGKKDINEVWLGILTDDKQSHQEAEKMLYDFVLFMYQTEADKKVEEAQKNYDRAVAQGISLSTKLQDNANEKIKLATAIEKNTHNHLKLTQHIEKHKVEEQRLKEALNSTLENSTDEDVIKKAQKHYDKAVSKGESLGRKLASNESSKLKLQEDLRKNALEKKELEVDIAQNESEQVKLKTSLDIAKQARAEIK